MGTVTDTKIDYTVHPRVNSSDPVAPRPRPAVPAHIVQSDAEAIEIAKRLAERFKVNAALRDREGLLPNIPKAGCGASMCQKPMAGRRFPMPLLPR
jgi:hypothetical protein